MTRRRKAVLASLTCLLFFGQVNAQGKTGIGGTAFEIMDRVFQQLQYAEGHQKLQLTITTREGKSIVYKASLYQKQNASFFVFDSMTRGTELKLLYNDQGQNIYAYLTHDKRMFHKKYLDRFENVLGSGFAYIDIANASFIDNYQQKIKGTEKNEEGRIHDHRKPAARQGPLWQTAGAGRPQER
jgi:hypothetical protein